MVIRVFNVAAILARPVYSAAWALCYGGVALLFCLSAALGEGSPALAIFMVPAFLAVGSFIPIATTALVSSRGVRRAIPRSGWIAADRIVDLGRDPVAAPYSLVANLHDGSEVILLSGAYAGWLSDHRVCRKLERASELIRTAIRERTVDGSGGTTAR